MRVSISSVRLLLIAFAIGLYETVENLHLSNNIATYTTTNDYIDSPYTRNQRPSGCVATTAVTNTPSLPPKPLIGSGEGGDISTEQRLASLPDPNIPYSMFILSSPKVVWCQASNTASATTKNYFLKISDGQIFAPPNSKYPVFEANFERLRTRNLTDQKWVKTNNKYTHVMFVRNVVERFVSGYIEKVVDDCKRKGKEPFAIDFYKQYGFSCDKHQNFEAFLSFMETVPQMESTFHAQASLCNLKTYPYTDIIYADNHFAKKSVF